MRNDNRSDRGGHCVLEIGKALVIGKPGVGFVVLSPLSGERWVFDDRDEATRFAFEMQKAQPGSEVLDVRSL